MAFRFPLASVLSYRESVERREELALQKILMEMAQVRQTIDQLTGQIAQAQKTIERVMQKALPAVQMQSMLNQANAAIERKRALIAALEALEQKREQQLRAYQDAHRSRRMLSDMAKQRRAAWDQERVKSQQKFLDDIFAARARRG
jgi:flagellar export protein FliJ